MSTTLLLVGAIVLLVNLPFGCWRAQSKRFSTPWMLAVHLPVPLVILIRQLSGIGFKLVSFPVIIGAFFLGQLIGAAVCRRIRAHRN